MTCGEYGGVNAHGEPCGRTAIDETGRCDLHREGADASEVARQRGVLGGFTRAEQLRRPGLTLEELPQLRTQADAEVFLERIARETATGRMNVKDSLAATRALEAWLKARSDRLAHHVDELERVLEEKEREIDELRRELGRPLRAVN